jgi:sugar phosphate isomerase/epimerase
VTVVAHDEAASGPAPMLERLGLLSSALFGWSPVAICDAASRCGLRALEWATGSGQALGPDGTARQAGHLGALSAEHGLAVCGLSVQDPDALSVGGFDRLLELTEATGASRIRLFAPAYRGGIVADELSRLSDELSARVSQAAARGITLLVEMAPDTLVPGPEWLVGVARDLSARFFGAVYDPASMIIEGHVAPRLTVGALGPYLQHVHVKDVVPRRSAAGWRWSHTTPGSGLVPWTEVLRALAESGYAGWLVIDHLGGGPSLPRLRGDVAAVSRLVEEAR